MGNLETVRVLWNPERYWLSRRSRLAASSAVGSSRSTLQALAGGEECFQTDLFLDSSRAPAGDRDLRPLVEKLESWMDLEGPGLLPPRLLFLWGSFRFRGVLVSLDQTWTRFDPDGTPTRGWLRLGMVR
jgi:hypothetical protein